METECYHSGIKVADFLIYSRSGWVHIIIIYSAPELQDFRQAVRIPCTVPV